MGGGERDAPCSFNSKVPTSRHACVPLHTTTGADRRPPGEGETETGADLGPPLCSDAAVVESDGDGGGGDECGGSP